jgi:hypothetical protein
MRRRHLVFWSLALGFIISILESVCTGQVYLPTIMYVLREGGDNFWSAFMYLVLYNGAFVVPLIVVFALTYVGVGSKAITDWFNRHVAMSKLLLGLLFLMLAVVLILGA